MTWIRSPGLAVLAAVGWGVAVHAQAPQGGSSGASPALVGLSHDSVTIHFADVDLRTAIELLSPYLDRPVVVGGSLPVSRVTFETPHAVPKIEVTRLVRGFVESQNLDFILDTVAQLYRVRVHETPPPALSPATMPHPGEATSGSGSGTSGVPQLFVIHLKHAKAADVAATVNALYGRASALGEPGGGHVEAGSGTLSAQLAQSQFVPVTGTGASTPAPQAVATVADRVATLSGETTIVPDAGTNSLMIRASRSDFDLIAAAVSELDVRPLQVLIEVVIAEVNLNSSWALGLTDSLPPQTLARTGGSVVTGSSTGLSTGNLVLQIMRSSNPAITATLEAAASRGEARILSRPVVLASNNKSAEILVGSEEPFIQVSQTQVGAVAQNQVVQYQDVGTKLTVLPTISGDGYVSLEITQEVNDATGAVSFNAPIISTRSVYTELLVKDNQTIVLGGLTTKEKDRNSSGIPILSSIPPVVIGIVRAGEAGSGLAGAVRRAAALSEQAAATRAALRAALAYPVILALAGASAVALLVGVVLPKFAAILSDMGQSLPASTRAVLWCADTIRTFALPGLVALVVGGLALRAWWSTVAGRRQWDAWLLRVPVIGRVRWAAASGRFAATLAALVETGVPITVGLRAAAEASGDAEIGPRVLAARDRVVRGETIHHALAEEHAVTPSVIRMIHAGEESGRLGELVHHAGALEAERAERLVRGGVRILEPALILVFGALVAFVAAALLQAVYSIRPEGVA